METLPNENDNSHCQLIVADADERLNKSNEISLENLKLTKQPIHQSSVHPIPQKSYRSKMRHSTYNVNSSNDLNIIHTISILEPKKTFAKIIIYFHIQTFIKRLLLYIRPPQPFSKTQHKIINDRASSFKNMKDFKNNKKQILLSNLQLNTLQTSFLNLTRKGSGVFQKILMNLFYKIPLIDPYDVKKLIWDGLMSLLRIYLLLWIPILTAFDERQLEDLNSSFIFGSLFLLIDIFLQTFTIKFDKGFPVKDRKQLLSYQFNFWTLMEICSVILQIVVASQLDSNVEQFSVLGQKGWIKIFLFLAYFQIRNILQFVENLQYHFKPSKTANSFIDLIKLVCLILVVLHVFSSLWIMIGTYYQQQNRPTWISKIYDSKWTLVYLESLYFISVTTFTVGYGDIQPQSIDITIFSDTTEKIFVIFYMFLCTLQLSYSVNTIGSILTQMKEINNEVKQKMTCITEYMMSKSISLALQYKQSVLNYLRVREYFNFYWVQEREQQKNAQNELIKLLPEDLQLSLKMEAASSLMKKCKFFQINFTEQFINKLLRESYFQSFQPGVFIQDLDNIYIIEQGAIEIVQQNVKIKTLNQYDYFSHNKLLNHIDQKISYKTATFTTILVVPSSNLMKLLRNDQVEYEKLLNKDDPNLIKCYICEKQHKTENCTLVHFIGDKEKIIKKHQFHSYQKRQKHRRTEKNERKVNCIDLDYNYETAEQIQEDFKEEINHIYPDIRDMPNFKLQTNVKSHNEDNRRMSILPKEYVDINQKNFLLVENQFALVEQKYKNLNSFSKREQEEINLLYKQLNSEQLSQDDNFEQIKEYSTFKPEWNIQNVLSDMSIPSFSCLNYRNRDRFKMYLLYPMIFYSQYKKFSRSFTKLELCEDKMNSPDDKSNFIVLFRGQINEKNYKKNLNPASQFLTLLFVNSELYQQNQHK